MPQCILGNPANTLQKLHTNIKRKISSLYFSLGLVFPTVHQYIYGMWRCPEGNQWPSASQYFWTYPASILSHHIRNFNDATNQSNGRPLFLRINSELKKSTPQVKHNAFGLNLKLICKIDQFLQVTCQLCWDQ